VSAEENVQAVSEIAKSDEAGTKGVDKHVAADEEPTFDDDYSVSEGGASSTKSRIEDSESSRSMRTSSGVDSAATGVYSRIAGHFKDDDKRICGARCLFFFVLTVAAVSLGTMVFMITSRDDQKDFEIEVRDDT
jgi:hypothetical protein